MEIKLCSRINAGQKVIDQHGEWWRVLAQEGDFYRLESLDYTHKIRPLYACKARRTIPLDGGSLFTVEDTRPDQETEPDEVGKWPILEKLLSTIG